MIRAFRWSEATDEDALAAINEVLGFVKHPAWIEFHKDLQRGGLGPADRRAEPRG